MFRMRILKLFLISLATLSILHPVVCNASRAISIKTKIAGGSTQEIELYRGSHALLIGESNYTGGWPKLESIPGELAKVEILLRGKGFTVEKYLNLDGDRLQRVFKKFVDKYGYKKENRLLFFYSGHGYTRLDGRKGYLVPVDAPNPNNDEEGFLAASLGMNHILSLARDIEAKHAIFLFDSCFSGTIFKQKDLPRKPPHISRATASPVRQFITAGSAGETVPANSVFTPAFIDALEFGWGDLNKDGYVSGTELGLYLQEKVPSHSDQSPQYGKIKDYDLSRGDFIFVTSPGGGAPPVLPPDAGGIGDFDAVIQQRKAAREKWSNWQSKMDSDYARAEQYDRDSVLTTQEKATVWNNFLSSYGTDNLYSANDDEMRSRARARKQYWQGQKVAMAPRPQPASTDKSYTDSTTGMEFMWVPGGCFQMGDTFGGGDSDEKPVHEVCVDGFYMGKYEVTQGEWRKVMGNNPARFKKGDRYPVEKVSWNNAREFIRRLNSKSGKSYRLPFEAEWEYGARSGGKREKYAGGSNVDAVAWNNESWKSGHHPVGTKSPNGLGIYDMSGNVWEWCQDWYDDDYYSSSPRNNPQGPSSGSNRVVRGGCWFNYPGFVRSANRYWYTTVFCDNYLGFRLVLPPGQE